MLGKVGLRLRNLGTAIVGACITVAVLASGARRGGRPGLTRGCRTSAGAKWAIPLERQRLQLPAGDDRECGCGEGAGQPLHARMGRTPPIRFPSRASLGCSATSDLGTAHLPGDRPGPRQRVAVLEHLSGARRGHHCCAGRLTPVTATLSSSLMSVPLGRQLGGAAGAAAAGHDLERDEDRGQLPSPAPQRISGCCQVRSLSLQEGRARGRRGARRSSRPMDRARPTGTHACTTWWVNGAGRQQVVFDHAGDGQDVYGRPPVTTVQLIPPISIRAEEMSGILGMANS